MIFSMLFTDDVCLTTREIDDWRRSVSKTKYDGLCDYSLIEGWYRITSIAGQQMPTVCPKNGYACGNHWPIWLSSSKRIHYFLC